MPTLHWIGKDAVVNHHKTVPFRLLRAAPELAAGASDTGNLLVEGDNLLALKALLPRYAGQVKCIYIDPPYNTGNEGWIYNDAVNAPEMQKWLHHAVGKEAEDLSRHDKWLCMMYPRLQLARQFLHRDGLIFVSIDDVERTHLHMIMDEIFGAGNFVGTLVWKRRQNVDSRAKNGLSVDHEYIIIYRVSEAGRLRGQDKDLTKYNNPDGDVRGPWSSDNLVGLATKDQRPNLHYDLVNPATNLVYPCTSAGWRYSKDTMARLIADGRILWPPKPSGRPRLKRFQYELTDEFTGLSSILKTVYNTQATLELKYIFDGQDVFDFPKPVDLIKMIVQQATDMQGSDIVLDFFAGSGTTGHAVMQLNREDGGNRRFLLVEMDAHIARNVTAERLRRVVCGVPDRETQGQADKETENSNLFPLAEGGIATDAENGPTTDEPLSSSPLSLLPSDTPATGFRYYTLGEPLFTDEGNISPSVTMGDLAQYVFYTGTGQTLPDDALPTPPLLGIANGTAIYLLWNGQGADTLTATRLRGLPPHVGPRILYGASCRLSRARLQAENAVFRQFPYQLETE